MFELIFAYSCFLSFPFSKMSGRSIESYVSDLHTDPLSKGEISCKNPVNLPKPHKYLSFIV